jgi:hypothetical protein
MVVLETTQLKAMLATGTPIADADCDLFQTVLTGVKLDGLGVDVHPDPG